MAFSLFRAPIAPLALMGAVAAFVYSQRRRDPALPPGIPIGVPFGGYPEGEPGVPPVGTPPVGTPPVGTPPVGTPPVGTPPVGTPPVGTPPVGTPPAGETPPETRRELAFCNNLNGCTITEQDGSLVATAAYGAQFAVIDRMEGWIRVRSPQGEGWVREASLTAMAPSATQREPLSGDPCILIDGCTIYPEGVESRRRDQVSIPRGARVEITGFPARLDMTIFIDAGGNEVTRFSPNPTSGKLYYPVRYYYPDGSYVKGGMSRESLVLPPPGGG